MNEVFFVFLITFSFLDEMNWIRVRRSNLGEIHREIHQLSLRSSTTTTGFLLKSRHSLEVLNWMAHKSVAGKIFHLCQLSVNLS